MDTSMDLIELKEKVNTAIEHSIEAGDELPNQIGVSIQIDDLKGNSICATEVELYYDNNLDASGCVLVGTVTDISSLLHNR